MLVDDHPAVLDAVGRFLESNGVDVVAALSNGASAVDEIQRLRPAVAVVDLHLPDIDGIELARRVIDCLEQRLPPASAQTSRCYRLCERFITVVDRRESRPVRSDRR